MAFWYSVRLRRRRVSVRPGFGLPAAVRSSVDSSHEAIAARAAAGGCGRFGGGMVLVRSLRTTFSQVSPSAATCATSMSSRLSPAVSSRPL